MTIWSRSSPKPSACETRVAVRVTGTVERVDLALACLAIDHRLGGILLIDLPPAFLPYLGQRLAAMLAEEHHQGEVVILGANQDDDDLWWVPQQVGVGEGFPFTMVPGPVVDAVDGPPRTLIIPDLARASLSVVRAAITVIGANAAVADRHGQHISWQPRARWLAACARADIPRLSPHLLDRFSVRVDAAPMSHARLHYDAILAAVKGSGDEGHEAWAELWHQPPRVTGQWRAVHRFPDLTGEAIETILAEVGTSSVGARRDLALARLARAIAVLKAHGSVLGEDVLDAAGVMGLTATSPQGSEDRRSPGFVLGSTGDASDADLTGRPDAPGEAVAGTDDSGGTGATFDRPGIVAENELTASAFLEPAALSDLQTGSYPEDNPGSVAEYTSLRETRQLGRRHRVKRGQIIGTEPTRALLDIAVVPTAFQAAKFQKVRRAQNATNRSGLIIFGSDLRRYRHLPRPDTAVVLVLDHTCRRGWDFRSALGPYLRWAYVRHAVLSVVELGYDGAPSELHATAYRADSVLDKRIARSLGRTAGRATPLAHALDMATQEMRRHLRQIEVVAGNSWLVVVSDGRGNVPLEASLRDLIPQMVAREGVTDALRTAQAARQLRDVHKVVLAPPNLTHYTRLPFDLADALGGIVAEDIQ